MESEAPMATRTLVKHNCDIGEAKVLMDFLLMGAAVNSLTDSDYGLDLHVQVPLSPQEHNQLTSSGSCLDVWHISGT